ncbi:uncharacterized protein LOC110063227 isoform X2 [Orbicella faveolata]|nr:uncharacterized protein LOC110063227 isoform X2 [Orbicella faveolata]
MEETRRGKDQNFIGGMEIAEKRGQPLRERRAVKRNSTEDILQRLQDLEQKVEALLQPRTNFKFLAKYFQERDGLNYGLGLMGRPGPPGPKGESGKSGVKYVRWGRTTCPSGAETVYKGIIGGESYGHQGGGANYLCLPLNPKYGKYKDGHQNAGYVYGAEYQVAYGFNPFKNIHDYEAVCAVCFTKTRGSMLMMPARNDCPSGWTEEYHGYLMTEYYKHNNQRDFICVDEDAEYVPGTKANKDGALLYPVEGVCGSLPCKPYVNGRELTCAVCTK